MKRLVLLTICYLPIALLAQTSQSGSDYIAKRLQLQLLNAPQQVPNASVSVSGNPGPATYYYWIVAQTSLGASSPAGPFQVSNAPNTLTGSNFNQISWATSLGAVNYDILRTSTPGPPFGACNCAVSTAVTGNSTNDQANALNAYAVNTFDPNTATIILQNISGTLFLNAPINLGSFPLIFSTLCYKSENGLAVLVVSASCGYTTWAAALADCPAAGCVLDGRAPDASLSIGTFDPGNKDVTMLFGPLSYTIAQLTPETNLHMIGAGSANHTGHGQTKITSIGSNATPLIALPSGNNPVQGVKISGINFTALSGNTSQDGLFADCSSVTGGGLWYSEFDDVTFTGFKGSAIHLKGPATSAASVNQWLTFKNVRAVRVAGAAEDVRIEGSNGQIKFLNSQFDGPAITDGTNIFIGQLSGGDTTSPYSIDFDLLTCQGANLCMQVSGVQGLSVEHGHFENLHGVAQFSLVGTTANYNAVFERNDFFGTVGVNAGNGFLLKSITGQGVIRFKNNLIEGVPDAIIVNTNLAQIIPQDNGQTNDPPSWTSTNITAALATAATLNIRGYRSISLNASATNITTFQSSLGPGECVNVRSIGTSVIFATGGNLNLAGNNSPLSLSVGETALFCFNDNTSTWDLEAYSHGTNTTLASMQFACTGTAAASSTLVLPVSSGTCSLTTAPLLPAGSAGTIKNLFCHSLAAGALAGSGVVTVRKNVVDQTLTCTFGTTTACSDATHSFSVVAGDTVDIKFTTQAGETLANIACDIEKR